MVVRFHLLFTVFPAELEAAPAVFVAWFQNKILPLRTNEREKFDRRSVVRRSYIGDRARPRHVFADQFPFRERK